MFCESEGQPENKSKRISWIWVAKTPGVAVYLHSRVYFVSTLNVKMTSKILWKRIPEAIWGKKSDMTNLLLSFGVLLACERNSKHICVSIINKRLSYPQRQTNYSAQQASCTDQQLLQALNCMMSLINGGILLAWAVFLEFLLITTITCWI